MQLDPANSRGRLFLIPRSFEPKPISLEFALQSFTFGYF